MSQLMTDPREELLCGIVSLMGDEQEVIAYLS